MEDDKDTQQGYGNSQRKGIGGAKLAGRSQRVILRGTLDLAFGILLRQSIRHAMVGNQPLVSAGVPEKDCQPSAQDCAGQKANCWNIEC
jgi:hypothetical protein